MQKLKSSETGSFRNIRPLGLISRKEKSIPPKASRERRSREVVDKCRENPLLLKIRKSSYFARVKGG